MASLASRVASLIGEVCESPCLEGKCDEIIGLLKLALDNMRAGDGMNPRGGLVASEAYRRLAEALRAYALVLDERGCTEEALLLEEAAEASEVLSRALRRPQGGGAGLP